MQIVKLVLYKDSRHVREISFRKRGVNIIVGDSKTGKSALIDIVDYCLASDECHIAAGVIRENVYWFAFVVDFGNDKYMLARMNPDCRNVSTISEMYLAKVDENNLPSFEDIEANTNVDTVRQFLASKIGLPENTQIVDDGGSRNPLPVTFMHSRQFCYQPQHLIANKDLIFYHTNNSFAHQALKDAIPYLFGAVREDVLLIERQIKEVKKELRRLYAFKEEQDRIIKDQNSLSESLVEEAKAVGLVSTNHFESSSNVLEILQEVASWTPTPIKAQDITNTDSELQQLVSTRQQYMDQLGDIQEKIAMAKRYGSDGELYASELKEQHQRLKSIELLPNEAHRNCPLCHQILTDDVPKVSEIYSSFKKISVLLEDSQKQTLRNQKYIASLIAEESAIKAKIAEIESSIHALYQRLDDARALRDLNVQRGKVIGRISLFLERLQLNDNNQLDSRIRDLEEQIESLQAKISKSTKEELMTSKTAVINSFMNLDWKHSLDLEDEEAIICFDPKRLQIYSISHDERYVPLNQMGSGANWVGYHLLIHFALHKFFVKNNRPVPRFLMLDQPSQIYFPSEGGACKDIEAAKRMFHFIIEKANEIGIQVILTEHADLPETEFQNNVIERWNNGYKLIPENWYNQ
jgi:hypothetical protein